MKILSLESWMVEYAKGEQGLLDHPFWIASYESQKPYFNVSYPYLTDVRLKDGWYLAGNCFFVFNGKAYKGDAEMFKQKLNQLCDHESIGNPSKIAALYKLEKEVYGKPTGRTSKLYAAVHWHYSGMQMRKASARSILRLRKMRKDGK